METEFADYETSKRLKALSFNEGCLAQWNSLEHEQFISMFHDGGDRRYINAKDKNITAPIWQQVKEWLWDNHKIRIDVLSYGVFPDCDFLSTVLLKEETLVQTIFQTPIEAEIEGIKIAVKYLSDTAVAVTPINTSANGA